MLRRRSLERRLFGWMLVLSLVPAVGLIAAGTWAWSDSLDRISALGPWDRVGESGLEVFEAAESAAATDPELAAALERHREELSASLLLARRWSYLNERVTSLLPLAAIILGAVLGAASFLAARRVARGLARPIRELVDWIGLIAREEPLPVPRPREGREVAEVRALRVAFRAAAGELRTARNRALEAERVRVWGEMARRLAHEMKNPLTPIRLALHRLSYSGTIDPDGLEAVSVIGEEVDGLEELARQFSQLGRPPEGPRSAVDLRELLASIIDRDVAPPVEARLDAVDGLPLVDAYYDSLFRLFRNLIHNAIESMEGVEGARQVGIQVRGLDSGAQIIDRPGKGMAIDWVEVRIADRGPGLPEGAEEWIFEPDFTTKSRGTGLGLTLVRQAVLAHGGTIELARPADGGAEFVVRLPVENDIGAAEILLSEQGTGP